METKVKVKGERVSWKLEGNTLELADLKVDLSSRWPSWLSLGEIEKYIIIYGIKQACHDVGAGLKDFDERLAAIKERFQAFINKDESFLPQGRIALTADEKQEIQELNTEFLVKQGLPESLAKTVAKSSGIKKLYLIKTD